MRQEILQKNFWTEFLKLTFKIMAEILALKVCVFGDLKSSLQKSLY